MPNQDYAVHASLTVNTPSQSTANTSALAIIATINTDLAGLAESVGFSAAEVEGTPQASPTLAWESVGGGSQQSVEGWVLVGAPDQATAGKVVKDAAAQIATAVSGSNPAVGVTLEQENGVYVLSQIG